MERLWRITAGNTPIKNRELAEFIETNGEIEKFRFIFRLKINRHEDLQRFIRWHKANGIAIKDIQFMRHWFDVDEPNFIKSPKKTVLIFPGICSVIFLTMSLTLIFMAASSKAYGHIQWSSYRQATGLVYNQWRKLLPIMGSPRLPLSNCNTDIETNRTGRFLLDLFIEQNKLSQARFQLPTNIRSINELGLKTVKGNWQINPEIELNGLRKILCGKNILEGHAHFLERSLSINLLSFPEEIAWNRDELPEIYTIAFDWFINECSDECTHIFPIICDLALQTSWNPIIPTNELEWQSSSPSWRFYNLTKILASNTHLKQIKLDSWPNGYVEFFKEILSLCRLKSLTEILHERLDSLQSLEAKPGLTAFQRIMKQAIEHRIKQPWLSVNPAIDMRELSLLLKEFRSPFVVIEGALQTQSTEQNESISLETVGELHFQAFIEQLLGNTSRIARESNSLECGFAKFEMFNGCPYQVSGECIGRFDPRKGLPIPLKIDEHDVLQGCIFGAMFLSSGIKIEDLVIDYNARFKEP